MHLPPTGRHFMVLEDCLKGCLVVIFTGGFDIKGGLSLNFSLGMCYSFLPHNLPKTPLVVLFICSSTGSSYIYHPVCIPLRPFIAPFSFPWSMRPPGTPQPLCPPSSAHPVIPVQGQSPAWDFPVCGHGVPGQEPFCWSRAGWSQRCRG